MDTPPLETQHLAVVGFRSWLQSSQPARPEDEDDHEFKDQLLQVLQVYEYELERKIEGNVANGDWFQLLALTSMTADLLKDALLEVHPELSEYTSGDDPATVEQMTMRLLCDAVARFAESQAEMSTYLAAPEFPGVLNNLMQTVLSAQ
jgi:hypothetical protein